MSLAEPHPFTTLQWLGPELARLGVLRNESWVPEHCSQAVKLYRNQGLHIAATLIASLHEHGLQYLEQAPVLALAASQGKLLERKQERQYVAQQLGGFLERGPKLKQVLALYGLPVQLRQLVGHALTPDKWTAVQRLARLPPSTLAQTIPKSVNQQAAWLRALRDWTRGMNRRANNPGLYFEWAAAAYVNADERTVGTVSDYALAQRGQFNERWTLVQALAAAERWHEHLAKASQEEKFLFNHGIGWTDPVDYGALPVAAQINGYEVVALRTGEDLFNEGRIMHHCVSSYFEQVLFGKSRLYSIRQGEKRLATFELSKGTRWSTSRRPGMSVFRTDPAPFWQQTQIKGPCNAQVPRSVQDVASKFVKQAQEQKPNG